MNKFTFLLLWLIAPLLQAQPVITNADKFPIGTILKFQNCQAAGVNEGVGGPNQTWNFSSLATSSGTLVKTMKSPSAAGTGSLFPSATLLEDCSDGTQAYILQTPYENNIVGFIDNTSSPALTMSYSNPMRTAVTPITFGTLLQDSFSLSFSSGGYNFKGLGTSTLTGDGYGTLILPTGTHTNVLRVKLIQHEVDSLVQMGTAYDFTSVTIMFFDGVHASSLLNINTVTTSVSQTKSVQYLIDETNIATGIFNHKGEARFICYPNPASGHIVINSEEKGKLQVKNLSGETVRCIMITENETMIELDQLVPGVYFIEFEGSRHHYTRQLLLH